MQNTAIDVIRDFRTLDRDRNGEITAVEFIHGIRSNPQLASKFGLSEDILSENGTRAKYELKFGSIDHNHTETVNVPQYYLSLSFHNLPPYAAQIGSI